MTKKPYEPKWMKARATSQARRFIGEFVTEHSEHLGEWVTRVAHGIPKVDSNGKIIRDADDAIVWVVRPAPGDAVKLVSDLAEFVLPKLSRSDVQMAARVEQSVFDPNAMSNEQLAAQVFEALGIQPFGQQQEPVDVEFEEVERVPEWLKTPPNS